MDVEATVAGIGHNGAPFDFFEFIDKVLATSATAAEKLIAIIHARQIARKNGESYLSRSRAQAAASVSDNTYQRALPVVRLFLNDTSARGRATTWTHRPDITAESVEEAILAMRGAPKAPPKSIPQNGVYPQKDAPSRGMGIPQNGGGVCPNLVGHKDGTKDRIKETTLSARPVFEKTREGLNRLEARLLEACNGAAADPASAPAILSMAEPIRWIEAGCDLELDIIPTIRSRAHKMRARSVQSWGYFTKAIADAKATRETPLPHGSPAYQRPKNWHDEQDELRAKYKALRANNG